MSEELERYEPQHPLSGNPAHVRLSIDDVGRVSKIIQASEQWKIRSKNPATGRWEDRPYTQAECWVIVMAGQSMGVAPIPAMSSFHMIEGRAEMSANLQAYFLQSSPKYEYRRTFEYDENDNATACTVTVFSKRTGEAIGDARFTMKMAKTAGLVRDGGNWAKYPGPMLFARAVSDAVAQITPDAVPMRIYSEGEISGQEPNLEPEGVQAVAGEGAPSTAKVEAAVNAALAGDEEVIEDADVEVEDTEDEAIHQAVMSEPEPAPAPQTSAQVLEQQVETRLREDLPSLNDEQKRLVKAAVTSARPKLDWGYKAIAHLIVKAGYSDVNTWINLLLTPGSREETPAGRSQADLTPVGESLPEGVTGAQTGSQSAATVTDAQIRMFNAKCSEAGLTDDERKYVLKHYAQVPSSRDIKKADFDDLLAVLGDIKDGDDATRRVYLGGD